ncbi:hypothetical protein AVU32_gp055 [Vibrio phage ValKK3]|uniref:Uncharacterized protein n=1 Tax=Vibrio phage ValKK3 TaxID=1610855 RepID=A0A0D4DAM3_9CAUD|nr:hypothetical protein AVU32_gp055 [Vibrio phage ValKK3]AJT60896.1 hypothetical protein [Vibrio phage ValKK3]
MPSNLNNIKIKDIREFGISTILYKDFTIFATEEADEIVLRAAVCYDENSDAHVSVTEVCGDTLKEAKAYLQAELNDVQHTAGQIAEMAIAQNDFVGQYEELVAKVTAPKVEKAVEPKAKAVEKTEAPKKTNVRGQAARDLVAEKAIEILGMTDITFEQRGKYKDWYIMSNDSEGNAFEQRLDVFKKKLVVMGAL